MTKIIELLSHNFFVPQSTKSKTIFGNIINILFLISLSLTLTIGRIYPLNYISNTSFIIMSVLMLVYVYVYGYFFIDRFVVLIVLLNIFIIVSNIMNKFEGETFTLTFLTIGMVPTYYYFRFAKDSFKITLNYIAIAYIIFILFFFALYPKEFITLDFTNRLGAKIANQNDIATFLLTGHSIFLYLILKKHIYLIPFLVLNLIEMIATGSRSGLLNIVIMTILIMFLLIGRKHKVKFIVIVILLMLFSYFLLYIPQLEALKNRFDDLFAELFMKSGTDSSTSSRIDLVIQAIEIFLRNPIFGNGVKFASSYTFDGNVAHNAFAELGASYGVFVLICFLLIFLLPLLNQIQKTANFSKIIIISFLVFYFTLSGYNYKPPYYIIPLLASMVAD